MSKPNYDFYHSKYLDTCSINEAERMMDNQRQKYAEAIRKLHFLR